MPCHPAATLSVAKRKISRKSKTPGALIYNVPGSRSGGIPLRAATDMVATPHCGARFLSVEKGFDEISATGGHRILSPRPFQVHGFKSPSFRIAEIRSTRKGHFGFLCRSGGIRTRGLLVPNQTRYQTALHLDTGADEGTRTPDLLITNRLLYQLSHIGTTSKRYYNKGKMVCPALFLRAGSTSDQWTDKPLYAKLLRNRNLPDPAGSTAEGTNHEL